jgi:aromatic-L-amino-acid/L-tryptophan decarboxylase
MLLRFSSMKSPEYLLEFEKEEARRLGYEIVDRLVAYQERLTELPVVRLGQASQLDSALREALPVGPKDPISILNRIESEIVSITNHETHPRFFAFIPGPSNFAAVLAEFLRTGYNFFAGSWLEGSGPAIVELTTLNWFRQLAGYPETARGTFLSGGSLANLSALVTARDHLLKREEYSRAVFYGSDQTHSSIHRALRILGFGSDQFRRLPSDENFRMKLDELEDCVARDRRTGLIPFCVIANAGTTNTGAIDPLTEMAEFCTREKLWLHADGAFGAAVIFSTKGRKLLSGLEGTNSFSLDPHKWLFQPFDCAILMVRDGIHLRRAFHVRDDEAEYLQDARNDESDINLWDYSPELTRPFRALKVWMTLQMFGAKAVEAAIDRTFELAEIAEREIRKLPDWEIVTAAQMAVLTFRYAPTSLRGGNHGARLDALNRAIASRMQKEAFALVLTTELRGKTVLRMCTINPRTTVEDLEGTVAALQDCAEKISQS